MASFITPSGAGCACGRTECTDECCVYKMYKPEPKPITHGDEIRAMTDKELADYMAIVGKINNGCPDTSINCQESCNKCWLDWLKQEGE